MLIRDFDIVQENPKKLWKEEAKLFLYKSDMMVRLRPRKTA
jgi:hypothetical protein